MRQDMTIEEIMEYQGRLYFVPKKQRRKKTRELLEFCGLTDYRRRTVRKLSGGMKRKLMVCRALLTEPEILLLDEITAALDPEMVHEVLEVVLSLADKGSTMLIVTHEMAFAKAIADRVLFLEHGEIAEESNSPKDFFEKPVTERARQFLRSFEY